MHRDEHANTVLTNEQYEAWNNFVSVMGERGRYVKYNSIHDIAEAGVTALIEEAGELMNHPAVRDAYEQFQTVCKLVKQQG